jgi:uncharacterized protein (DUF885 family)
VKCFPAIVLCFLLLIAGACSRQTDSSRNRKAEEPFSRFVDDYFARYYSFYPSLGTAAGFHEFDSKLEDFSAKAVQQRAVELHALLARLASLQSTSLSETDAVDASILEGQLRAEILETEELRWWRRNPMQYVSTPGGAVDGLMKREFSSPPERLRLVTERLKQTERLLTAMRDNVREPPREFTELAARIALGSVSFFRDTVTAWAKQAAGADTRLFGEFTQANRRAVAAFQVASDYLEKDLIQLSTGSYAIGSANFSKKLLYEEMVDTPLEKLLQIGEANLQRDHKSFLEFAKRIDASKSPGEVMRSMSNEHPSEDALVAFARSTLNDVRQFVVDRKIITIPSEQQPTVNITPPYARNGAFASMDTPGPYEAKANEAFYYVTPPEADWTPEHKQEHLRLFNKPVMDVITIHEAFPGHFVQFLYAKQFPTKTRKLVFCGTNVEGWAHYTEQMLLEEGFGKGSQKLKLAQLAEALLRDARYIAGIKLHTQNMTVEDAAKIFAQQAFQEPANAYEEARRGAYNPTYLYYTLGKLQIYKLREDYKRKMGADYSMEKFHTDFVKQGGAPLKVVRKIMLGEVGETL